MINLNPEPRIPVKGKAALEVEFDMNLLADKLFKECSNFKYYKVKSKLDLKEYLLKEQITNDQIVIN